MGVDRAKMISDAKDILDKLDDDQLKSVLNQLRRSARKVAGKGSSKVSDDRLPISDAIRANTSELGKLHSKIETLEKTIQDRFRKKGKASNPSGQKPSSKK